MAFLYAAYVLYFTAYASLSLIAWRASRKCQSCQKRRSCSAASTLLACDDYIPAAHAQETPSLSGLGVSERPG
jgi:hypothetical protein